MNMDADKEVPAAIVTLFSTRISDDNIFDPVPVISKFGKLATTD